MLPPLPLSFSLSLFKITLAIFINVYYRDENTSPPVCANVRNDLQCNLTNVSNDTSNFVTNVPNVYQCLPMFPNEKMQPIILSFT
jgi:hypothetical protein